MAIIQKAKETMTSKERVQKTFNFEKTDRVTIGYDSNPVIHKNLCTALGINPDNYEAVYEALGVDYRNINAPYTGPDLFTPAQGRMINQLEGSVMRWIEHDTGGYWDYCDFPLKDATDDMFESFPVPNPDHFDYDEALAKSKSYDNKYGLYIGNSGIPDIINSNGRIMGMEDVLCHLAIGSEAVMDFINRRANFQFGMLERTLEKCKEHIDFMWFGEDLGTQIAPMIGLELYRSTLKPIHKRFAELALSYNLPSIIHTCGSSSWVYEDLIEIGIKGVDTLQPEAVNMSPEYLVKHFGGRLNFRGFISTAGPLAYGTVEEVREQCIKTLDTVMPVRGYHFAPTHQIQDNSPVENVIAMYQTVHAHGVY